MDRWRGAKSSSKKPDLLQSWKLGRMVSTCVGQINCWPVGGELGGGTD